MSSDKNNVFQTLLVVYNLAILTILIFFIYEKETGDDFIFTGIFLFFMNLFLPFIIFLRQQSWGKYARPIEEEIMSPILKGLKDYKNSNKIEKRFALSYIFWLIIALLLALYGWLIS